jgi:hypothetical protein
MQKKLALLLDDSGSMASHKHTLRSFLDRLQLLLDKKDVQLYARTFSGYIGNEYVSVADLRRSYSANGSDTDICGSLSKFLDSLNTSTGFQPTDKVLSIVFTDGQDGHYDSGTAKNICERIRTMETALRWDWLFMGTDKKAIEYSTKLGIKPGKTLQMSNTAHNFEAALNSLLNIIDGWAEDKVSGDNFFTDADRSAAVENKVGSRLI